MNKPANTSHHAKNILLTGRPRVGKSTIIKKVVEKLCTAGYKSIAGFYTAEIIRDNKRVGFSINTLDGRIGRLAEVGFESPYRLGKYGIDMKSFEAVALTSLEHAIKTNSLIVIDEIGYMELKSKRFRELVIKALDSPAFVLAAIMRNKFDFADIIKARNDVEVITIRTDNRNRLTDEIAARFSTLFRNSAII
ncbi:MAG TPA: NTPase [Thermodesulfobacteriota bacterium]|nr:NTPase [Thermodesulfobacteriota bacterium]